MEYIIDIESKTIWVVDEVYRKGILNNEIARLMKNRGWDELITVADNSEKKSVAEFNTIHGLTRVRCARKGNGSVVAGIDFIQQFEIIVHPRCRKFKEELENYSYKKDKKTDQSINEPVDMYNHCIAGDTLIDTVNGQKPMIDLVGTTGEVFCFDESKGKCATSKFFDVRKTREAADIFLIETVDGRKVKATADHLFLTTDGWKEVKHLTEEDVIIDVRSFTKRNEGKEN